jgi:hypothetical protein
MEGMKRRGGRRERGVLDLIKSEIKGLVLELEKTYDPGFSYVPSRSVDLAAAFLD